MVALRAGAWVESPPRMLSTANPAETRVVRAAAVQLPQRFGNPSAALAELEGLLASGALADTDLALLPETILTGYVSPLGDFDLRPFAEPLDGPTSRALAALAQRYGIALAGPLVEYSEERYYNSLLLFDRGGALAGHFRKRHPWFPEGWASPGDLGSPIVELYGVRITAAICFDIHFVSKDAGAALDQADILLFPSAWVDSSSEGDARAAILPPLAQKHRIAIVNANWAISLPQIPGQGGSRILDAHGHVLAQAPVSREPQIVRATLGFGPVKERSA